MSIESLKNRLPAHARDLKLNLSSLASEQVLSEQQKAGTFLATAIAARNEDVLAAIEAEFLPRLTPEAATAARAAASIMAMNNVYYRFVHLVSAAEYKTLPARLRMNVIASPGVEKADFELWSIAVSAVNGCGMCIDSHERELRKHGLAPEQVQAAIRIAAVVFATAVTLGAETGAGRQAEAA